MAIERILEAPLPDEEPYFNTLRPRRLDDCIGQNAVREQLRIALDAARGRREPLDHVLLDGPPGLGKTTLAHVIAHEMNRNIRITSGPAISKQGDLMMILTQLDTGDVLFVDEIHRLNKAVEEFLYPALEDFRVDYTTETGIGGRTVNFSLRRFTFIGATTRAGMLSAALRDRFGLALHLKFYSTDELVQIVRRNAALLEVRADADALERLAARSRGTPRIVNRLLRRVRDYADVRGDGVLTTRIVDAALDVMQVDCRGLDENDRGYLMALIRHYDGGPAGVEALAATLGQERDTLEDVVEPYLLQIGFVIRTRQGRVARPAAYEHLKLPPPARDWQPGLFELDASP
ncbi:MAG: Holliday junction ATP-dependent DNA helicase RuvB [Phycisphaerae bacterium]|nr:Holliday junction ATP-dependent DNA helicase RuvB [Phycisphaerae bacterium]